MNDIVDVEFILFFDCPESVMEARLLDRGKTSGRTDDNLDSIRKRFKTFEVDTSQVIDLYRSRGRVVNINSDRSPDEVFVEVSAALAKLDK